MPEIPWTSKYHPSLKEIAGQDRAVDTVLGWVKKWKPGSKPLLLHGGPGTGKTAIVQAVASEFGYELIELNASDRRTEAAINQKAGSAATQASLFGRKKIILIDEIDGIYGTVDRGGVPAISDLFKKTSFPLILTANDPYRQNIRSLREKCELVPLHSLNYKSVARRLEQISSREKIGAGKNILEAIARRSGGDMRAAIMNLQTLAGKKGITINDVNSLDSRDMVREIFETLQMIFRSSSMDTALKAMNESDKNPDELFLWVEQNLPLEYSGEDLARAYDILSRADVFRGRIRRRQHWGFLRYVLELISAGVSSAKTGKNPQFVKYKPPSIIFKMGRTRFERARRNSIAEKIGEKLHQSKSFTVRTFPYLRLIMKDKDFRESIAGEAGLEEKEVDYLIRNN